MKKEKHDWEDIEDYISIVGDGDNCTGTGGIMGKLDELMKELKQLNGTVLLAEEAAEKARTALTKFQYDKFGVADGNIADVDSLVRFEDVAGQDVSEIEDAIKAGIAVWGANYWNG